MATLNGEKYIRQQLESILSQLSADDEIIISDDLSTDKTLDVVRSLGAPQIRIVHNTGEHGYTANFEHALKQAKGEIIFLSDQDDVWAPNKVETCLRLLADAEMVVSDAQITDAALNVTQPSFFAIRRPRRTLLGNIVKFGYLGCCMAFRREVLERAMPFPKKRRMCTHDNWLFLVASAFFRTQITQEPLIFYRRHENTTSSGGIENTTTLAFKAKYRLYLVWSLLRRALRRR